MLTAKNVVYIGLWLENCCLVGVIFLGGGGEGANEQIFGWWGNSPVWKTL